MMEMFRKTEDAAGSPNILKQFRIPMASAASETKKRYGKMMRFNVIACSYATLVPEDAVNVWITAGEKIMPITVIIATMKASVQNRLLAKAHTSARDFSRMYFVKTGMNEEVIEPSPTNLLKRLGMR